MSGEKAPPAAAPAQAPNAAPPAAGETKTEGTTGAAAASTEGAAGEQKRPETPPARSWAMLEQQEQRQRREREAFAAEREKFKQEQTAALEGARTTTLEQYRKRAAAGDYEAVATELGLDYKAWTQARINALGKGGKGAAANAAVDVEKQIREGIARELAAREEQAKAASATNEAETWKQQWSGFVGAVTGKSTNPADKLTGDHELLIAEVNADPKGVEDVLREMSRRGTLTYQQAADAYEGYLVDKARKLLQSSKVKALLAPATKPNEQTGPGAEQGQEQQTEDTPRTLTNAHAAASSSSRTSSGKPLSKTQRIAAQRDNEKALLKRAAGR